MIAFDETLHNLKDQGRFRELKDLKKLEQGFVDWNGKQFLNLSSNDYLGIGCNTDLHKEFFAQIDDASIIDQFGLTSASSRLLTGNAPAYTELEHKLSKLFNRESALIFNSGYHANIGILPALTGKKDLILSDKLNHASIIDGCKLSDAKIIRYKHNDLKHLESILHKQRSNYERVFIVSESIFSMDGNCADLKGLISLKKNYDCLLYIDEAHAFGTRGKKGLGKCEEDGIIAETDIIVGTFGKAAASQGAYAIVDDTIKQMLVNKMRSLIFTTALPPINLTWTSFIIDKIVEMNKERKHLSAISTFIHEKLAEKGFSNPSTSNIIPIIAGEDKKAIAMAEKAQEAGFLAFAIRPPTVPEGTSRLRLSLSANNKHEDLQRFIELI